MKVQDIRSFFNKPAAGSSRSTASRSREPSAEQVVDVPSRLKKGSSKKSKKDDDRLNISIDNSDDHDSDREDPLPKKARKKEDRNGKGSKHKSRTPVIDDDDEEDDSDKEDPLPRSSRQKKEDTKSQDKKRKARVLSDSDDDDFKPAKQSQKPRSVEKPAAKQLKVDRSAEKKKEELKPVNPADFFSSAPVKRETKVKKKEEEPPKPEPKESKKSPAKVESEAASTSSKSSPKAHKSQNDTHKHKEESSPQKVRTSIIEPKKLTMETPTPEKRDRSHSKPSKSESTPEKKLDTRKTTPEKKVDTRKKTPEKVEPTFKAPTPVTTEKSKSRTNRNAASSSSTKRSITTDDDDDEGDDFNPRKKSTASKSAKSKPDKPDKNQDKTPVATDEEDDAPKPAVSTPKQNYMKYLAKMSMKPKNLGSKNIPVGAPNCLQGLTFVISGVLDSLERDDCKDLCVKYGGRVTGSVSGKTSYLIIGDEPGESKVKKAVQMKVPQIDEDGLLEMIRKSNPSGNSQDSGLEYSEDVMSVDDGNESAYDAEKSLFSSPASTKADKSSRNSSPKKLGVSKLAKEDSPKKIKTEKSPEKKEVKKEVEKVKAEPVQIKRERDTEQPTSSKAATAPAQPVAPADAGLMWVDKYKPKTLKTVVGQGTETSNARKLVKWLQNWFKYHGSAQDKPKASWPGLKDPEGKTFKAALLSGPPGIGKTTSAHLAVKEVGYDYFELNASDTRNKRGLHENVADALSSKCLVFNKGNEELARKHVLIMDEVDGMSGNEDRGGVQELIALIKSSRVPLICICNDRNHPKIRSLASYCFDLRFNKPSFEQLKGFISSICFREKIKIPQEKVQQLIISTDNDVRQILHQLELFKDGKTDQAYNPKKDLRFGPWDVIRKVFLKSEHAKMSIHDKNGLFFQDYNIGPLFVQENYLKWTPAKAGGDRYKHMDLLSKTASSLADGDMVESVIRRSQNWGLLPVQAVFASYIPGEYMESNTMGNVEFPQWLGKNSNKTKRHRLLQSLHTHLHLHVSGSLEALNMDYLPYLRRSITKPLVQGDHEEAAKVMENYTLLREDVDSITDLSLWPGAKDPMERVDTRVKTAFTKQVNKEVLPYSNAKPVKGKGRGGGGGQEADLEALMEEGEGEVVEEEEDDSVEKDAMVKMRTRKAGSSKASSSKAGKGKGKKAKDDEDDDEDEDIARSSKGSKSSKQSSSSRSRKGK